MLIVGLLKVLKLLTLLIILLFIYFCYCCYHDHYHYHYHHHFRFIIVHTITNSVLLRSVLSLLISSLLPLVMLLLQHLFTE